MANFPLDFNDALPAAPANGVNVKWAADAPTASPRHTSAAIVGPGGTTQFLRADGTWSIPPGAGSGGVPTPVTRQVYIACVGSQSFAAGSGVGNFGVVLNATSLLARVTPTSTQTGGSKTTGSGTATSSAQFWESSSNVCLGTFRKFIFKMAFDSITSIRVWIGMGVTSGTAGTYQNDLPADNFFGFRFAPTTAGDAHIKAYVGTDATHQTIVDTGITANTAVHTYEVDWDGTSFTFFIDGALVATITTNIPAASVALLGLMHEDNAGVAVARTTAVYAFYYEAL